VCCCFRQKFDPLSTTAAIAIILTSIWAVYGADRTLLSCADILDSTWY
jgi:hypothetical protein